MKTLSKFMILIFLLITVGCSKDDNDVVVVLESDAKALTSFVFSTENNQVLSENITATISEESKDIVASVPSGTDIKALSPNIQVSANANVTPIGPQDFSSPVAYTVTAEDGSTAIYEVTITVSASDAKQIFSFILTVEDNPSLPEDVSAIINTANTIFLTVPNTIDVETLKPTITASPGANVSPVGETDFNNPVVYTVTASDGSTQEYTVEVSISISQKEALVAIADANPNFSLDWSLNEPIENWDGVTVENELVTSLQLRNANIVVLPYEIEALVALKDLDLDTNNLVELPRELFGLTGLETLRLRNNKISEIMEDIGNLNKLQILDVTKNQLKKLPEEIGELSSLTKFSLNDNFIEELPLSIGNLKSLITLEAFNNALIGLPEEIQFLTELEFLVISNNSIKSIPQSIGQLEKLNVLLIANNELVDLPTTFNNLKNLQFLDVTNNLLSNLPLIDNLQNLEYLGLSNAKFKSIPEQVFALTNLVSLSIDNNLIDELSEKVFALKNLEILNVSNNLISVVSPEIQNISALKRLDLSNNKIISIPKEITLLENVVSFKIENNEITALNSAVCDWIATIQTVTIDASISCN